MIAKWIIVAILVLSTLLSIASIGKPRKTLTPGVAVVALLINAAIITTIIIGWPEVQSCL